MLTMRSALERALRIHGANTAIVDDEKDFTWAAHMERVMRLATVLGDLGIGPGDRFGIICRNTWRHCELLHAGYWNGSIPVPVNYRLAPPEIGFILEDSKITRLFVEDAFPDLLAAEALAPWRDSAVCIAGGGAEAPPPRTDEMIDAARPADGHASAEDDDAILLYTGGTTGRSKGVRLSHRNVVSNGMQCAVAMKMRADDVYLHVAPMFHSADLLGTGYTLVGGGHAYLPVFTPANLLAALRDHRATSVMLAPTMIILTLQDPDFSGHGLGAFRRLFYGSSPMAVEWIRRTMEAFPGVAVQQGYGLTETSPILTTLDEEEHAAAIASGEHSILRAAGRPVIGLDMRILRDGAPAAAGEAGEVSVRGPNVTRGYLNRPDDNARTFADGWFLTGDVGRMDENGYLYLLDRSRDVIITGGENVYSSEVEAVLYQHEDVVECAVVGIPDETFGEALFAAVVARPGSALDADRLVAHCRGRIGGYKIPRRYRFVEELPKSAMGKILKTELRKIYGGSAT